VSGDHTDPRILVVDDDENVVETFRIRLQDEYDVDVATSGQEALKRASDEHDVVLLDRQMPGLSGDQVLEELVQRNHDCRVIMVTAVEPDPSILDLSCTDYVVKPVDGPELERAIDRALRISEYDDRQRELSSKKLKRNVLEVELTDHELQESERYQRLVADIDRLESEVDELESSLDLDDVSTPL